MPRFDSPMSMKKLKIIVLALCWGLVCVEALTFARKHFIPDSSLSGHEQKATTILQRALLLEQEAIELKSLAPPMTKTICLVDEETAFMTLKNQAGTLSAWWEANSQHFRNASNAKLVMLGDGKILDSLRIPASWGPYVTDNYLCVPAEYARLRTSFRSAEQLARYGGRRFDLTLID